MICGHHGRNEWFIASFTTILNLKINPWSELKLGEVGLHRRVELETILEDLHDDLKELEATLEYFSADTKRSEC